MTTATEVLDWTDLKQGTAAKADILRAYRLADEGGTIQAWDAAKLFSDPTAHTTMRLRTALLRLGCVANPAD